MPNSCATPAIGSGRHRDAPDLPGEDRHGGGGRRATLGRASVSGTGGMIGFADLDFDPAQPFAPNPTLTVTPATGLRDLDTVALSGDGYAAGNRSPHASGVRCVVADPTLAGCPRSSLGFGGLQIDPAGHLSGSFQVAAQIG